MQESRRPCMRTDREGLVGKVLAVVLVTGVKELFSQIDFLFYVLRDDKTECILGAFDYPADDKTIGLGLSEGRVQQGGEHVAHDFFQLFHMCGQYFWHVEETLDE